MSRIGWDVGKQRETYVAGYEVEARGVELVRFGEVGHYHAVMT
jgi:hypothetical protein